MSVRIPRRFNGPRDSGNGGYTCGVVAALLDGEAEVSLRSPPPLDRDLAVERDGDAVRVSDGDVLVAEGRRATLDLDVPEPVDVARAAEASRHGFERWSAHHPFPTCFVCGPERDDGLDIFPGPLGSHHAATWTPAGEVTDTHVWAALDCPTSAPVANFELGRPVVLASLAVRIEGSVEAGEPHVILSWPIEVDGRKRRAGAALYDAAGRVLARSRALWIELRQ